MSHHHHDHSQPHAVGRLVAGAELTRGVHRVGRRQFLADLGRRTFALAILGTGAAACSSSSSPGPTAAESTPDPTAAPEPTAVPEPVDETPVDEEAPQDEEALDEEAQEADAPLLQWSQVSLGFVSAYVLVRGNEAAVVDTGNPGSADEIGAALAGLGVGYGDVGHVVLTHHHPDHIGSLNDVLTEAPGATAYAGAADIENIASPNPLRAVGDGDDVFGLQIIDTPGHTPGSISVLDTGIGLLVAGDALNGNDAGTEVLGPNPDFTADIGTANQSVEKLAGLEFDIAAFGHGNPVEGGAGSLVAGLVTG